MTARTSILVLAAVATCGAIAFMLLGRGDADDATASTGAPRIGAAHRTASHVDVPTLPVAGAPAVARVDAPIPGDDTEYPVDPTPPTVEARLTDEERDPRIARSIELVDQAAARATARLAEAEAAGDQAAANTARVRIKRLHDVRNQRASGLGVMR
jgi:hypothetical protein